MKMKPEAVVLYERAVAALAAIGTTPNEVASLQLAVEMVEEAHDSEIWDYGPTIVDVRSAWLGDLDIAVDHWRQDVVDACTYITDEGEQV